MTHVFISYSRKDQKYARKLADHIRNNGFDVWIDDHIDYGDRWWRTIEDAIQDSGAFAVVMSPSAKESEWVEREIIFALDIRKRIFPILLEGKRFPILASTQEIDVTDGKLPPSEFFEVLSGLLPRSGDMGRNVANGTYVANSKQKRRILPLALIIGVALLLVAVFAVNSQLNDLEQVQSSSFVILAEESEAVVSLDYMMGNFDTTITATTNDISGVIELDFDNPANAMINEIRAEASSLTTGGLAVEDAVLTALVGEEAVIFEPVRYQGLPTDKLNIGDSIRFEMIGNLTMRGLSNATSVTVIVNIVEENRLEGIASTAVQYQDFGIEIPPILRVIPNDVAFLDVNFVAIRE